MQLEIKFRGYNGEYKKKNGRWIIGNLVRHGKNLEYALIMPFEDMGIEQYPVRVETVGQFTGLKDKNGTDIWKGDIVKTTVWKYDEADDIGTTQRIRSPVFFKNGCFCTNTRILGHIEPNRELEVIGNIYENPELLTNKKD